MSLWSYSLARAFSFALLVISSQSWASTLSHTNQPTSSEIRIISLSPHLTEMVYSAGAGDLLVGVVSYSNYPKQALSLPVVGGYNALNFEQIIALKPTLILGWQSGNTAKDIQRLKQFGFKVLLTEVTKLSDIPDQIEQIGKLTHRENLAQPKAQALRLQLKQLKQHYQNAVPVSVFYQVWNKPLYTISGRQFISQGMELCQGRNVFADLQALAPQVSIESIIQKNPSLILLGGTRNVQQQWLASWQAYPVIDAVKNQNIKLLDADAYQRPTARFINALPALCQIIQPEK